LGERINLFAANGTVNGFAGISISDTKDQEGRSYYILSFQNQGYKTIRDVQIANFLQLSR